MVTGENRHLYASQRESIEPSDNSITVEGNNALALAVDSNDNSFVWKVAKQSNSLKVTIG